MANELRGYRDPFQAMQDQTWRMMQQLMADPRRHGERGQQDETIVPPAEALEEDNAYRLLLEIPGVDPKEVDVSVVGNTLTVKAERRLHRQDGQQGQQQGGQQQGGQQTEGQQAQQRRASHVLFSELQSGVIRREFGLPEDADRQNINAEFRNGLLVLTIPKSQEAHQRRRIEIRSS
jgi:HSP20 family protein